MWARTGRQQELERSKQIRVPFARHQPRELADDKIFRRESKLPSQRQIRLRGEERREGEAAENFGVIFRPPDVGGEVIFFHRLGDDDKMVGDFGGVSFGGGENKIGRRALKISERRAVDVMNDDRHAGAFRGEPSEDSRLAAVGVDEVRLLRAENFFQLAERDEIFQRVNGADEFGDELKLIIGSCGLRVGKNSAGLGFERTFGADGGAGDQIDFDAGLGAQAAHGGEGVFLRAADDEPGDDVGDFQAVEQLNN